MRPSKLVIIGIIAALVLVLGWQFLAHQKRHAASSLLSDAQKITQAPEQVKVIEPDLRPIPTSLSKVGRELVFPQNALVQKELLSPSGKLLAVLVGHSPNQDALEIYSAEKVAPAQAVMPSPPQQWQVYSHHWLSETELALVFLAQKSDQGGGAAKYRVAKWTLNQSDIEFISAPEPGFFTIVGHLAHELFIFDDAGPNKVFKVVDLRTGGVLRRFDWTAREDIPFPWLADSELPQSLRDMQSRDGGSYSIKATNSSQVPSTHRIGLLLTSTNNSRNVLVTFDMESMAFVDTPQYIRSFFDLHQVTSIAWSPDGSRLWCGVGSHANTELVEVHVDSGESHRLLAANAWLGVKGASPNKLLLRGVRDLSPAVTMEDIPTGSLGTIYRPFIYDLALASP